jgi:exopolysaccharide biosynthesis polyprenyl glycosylphosphotransferase
MVKRQNINYALFSYALDIVVTLGSLALAHYLRPILPLGQPLSGALVVVPTPVYGVVAVIWTVVFFALSVYDPNRVDRAVDELRSVVLAILFAELMAAGALFFSFREVSRFLVIYFFILDFAALIGWRITARGLYRLLFNGKSHRPRRVIIVGGDGLGRTVAKTIQDYSWSDLELVGFLDDDRPGPIINLPVLGTLDETYKVVERTGVEEVVIALPYRAYEKLNSIVASLQTLPVQVRVVPDYFSLVLYRATVEDFGGLPLINLRDPALTPYQRLLKRAFDLVVGSLSTVFSAPIMALIALAIKLDSPGPVIFEQQRVGENGRLFTMYKFRSMVTDAEARQKQVNRDNGKGQVIHKVRDDPRVTRVGSFIRRTSLDELPQLINVLKGDLSLVGPRPELPWLVEKYEPWQRKRFAVPQGMTGWWQVNGRSDKPMHLNTEDDLYYIQHYSLLLDLHILWKTVSVVLKSQGAY